MPKIKINDAEIYYELHGKGEPLILISGYAADHLFWSAILNVLQLKYQVLIFDNRASGQTRDSSELDLNTMARDVIELAKQLKLDKPHILGHSMGGMIAQIIASEFSDEIGKVILMNTGSYVNARVVLALQSHFNLRKNDVSLDLVIDVALPWFFGEDFLANAMNVKLLKDAFGNNSYLQSINDQGRQLKALKKFDARENLKNIKNSVLIIASEKDIISLVEDAKYMHDNISRSKLHFISGGHSSPIEEPQKVTTAVLEFLNS